MTKVNTCDTLFFKSGVDTLATSVAVLLKGAIEMNLAQVKSLYNMLKGGEATLAEAEADGDMGPMLSTWRQSLDDQGSKTFQGLASLALRGVDEATGKGYDADVLFSMMKGERNGWFVQLTTQVRELAAAVGISQAALVWDRSLVGKMLDQYDTAHPVDPAAAPAAELVGDDLEADLEAILGNLEAGQPTFPAIRKWLGRDRAQHAAGNGNGDAGTGPLPERPRKFGSIVGK